MNRDDFPAVEWDTPNERPWNAPQQLPAGALHGRPGVVARPSTYSPGGAPGPAGQVPVTDPHHYARIIEGNVAPGVAGDPNTLAPFLLENSVKRNLLGFRNASAAANIYISFGMVASTFSWIKLIPGQIILFDEVVPQNDVYATADAVNGLLSYSVSTIPG